MPAIDLTIADTPPVKLFTKGKLQPLLDYLDKINDRTLLVSVGDPHDVQLKDDARTRAHGYRYSTLALKQVCSILSSGLTALIFDVSGLRRTRTRVDSVVSVPAAARIMNLCVDLRFQMQEGLYNRQLVVDLERKTIDGVLGAGYKYLPHADLVRAVNEAVADLPVPTVFESAEVFGRHLTAVWRQQRPLFKAPDGKWVYAGYYVTNSEAGECSVGAAVALMFGDTALRCLLPVTANNRVIHAGKSFGKKLAAVLSRMIIAGEELGQRGRALSKLAEQPLDLVDELGKVKPAQQKKLIGKLVRCGLKPEISTNIVRMVLWAGAMGSVPDRLSPQAAATRTAYDLFIRMCHEALAYPYVIREMIEKAAFELLSDKIKFD